MNVKYYPAQLSALIIDADLAMGAHGITLGAAQTVDGIDVSLQKTNMDNLIRQMHPNVSVLAEMDEALNLALISGAYLLISSTLYDDHLDESIDAGKWTTGNSGGTPTFSEADDTGMRNSLYVVAEMPSSGSANSYIKSNAALNFPLAILIKTCAFSTTFGSSSATFTVHLVGSTSGSISVNVTSDQVVYIAFNGGNSYTITNLNTEATDTGDIVGTPIVQYYVYFTWGVAGSGTKSATAYISVETTGASKATGNIITDAIAANAAIISFFSHIKGKFSNGDSTHALPVGVEIYGNGDSYAAALNATTKFKIDVADPIIEMYRIDDSVVAKSGAQEDWVLDDNATNGAFASKTTSTHETILAEEIGCASVVMVEKSVNGLFTDTEILVEDDDYTVDYSTRTATKIILTSSEAADIVISQSKLRITWIADVEDIEGTANTALKMKIYLNRTTTGEASPEIQKIGIGTDKYADMQYVCG
jgi:hypothetical protein